MRSFAGPSKSSRKIECLRNGEEDTDGTKENFYNNMSRFKYLKYFKGVVQLETYKILD